MIPLLLSVIALVVSAFAVGSQYGEASYKRYLRELERERKIMDGAR